MALEVQRFPVVIPAGTTRAAPVQVGLAMPPRLVDEVEIVVPPGPRGEVGFQLGSGGIQIIPVTPGQFFVTDNEVIHWPLEGQIDSGAWQLIAYNTGAFNHTLEIRFLVRVAGGGAAERAPQLIESAAFSSPAPARAALPAGKPAPVPPPVSAPAGKPAPQPPPPSTLTPHPVPAPQPYPAPAAKPPPRPEPYPAPPAKSPPRPLS